MIQHSFSTLNELLHWRARTQPQQRAYTFLVDGEKEAAHLSYEELNSFAGAIANLLHNCTTMGERVLLFYPPGLEFIAAFFGCLSAGVIAVPAYPPRSYRSLARIAAISMDAQATVALTTSEILAEIKRHSHQIPQLDNIQWLTTDFIAHQWADQFRETRVTSDTLAFLQYTSGSTGTPKGVMVSHGNILHNQQMIQQAMGHTEKTIFVGWLPLFHDMGLVGNVLQPLYLGIPCILMSPVAFLQKPWRWLHAISRYRATTSGGPNFAYDLCVQKITPEQRATLDLSSWQVAFNGAEPIRAATVEQFANTFAECGFHRQSFYPCYGMAETTLIVSGSSAIDPPILQRVKSTALSQNQVVPAHQEETDVQILVSSGQPLAGLNVAIVNPHTCTRCSPNEVGEIWVAGASVCQGYWHQKAQTEYTFHAYLQDNHTGPFLRTGDLGFLQGGQLFITGRLKDLIIIRGRNYYPQDIELTVEQSHPALRPNCGAAFSIDVHGEERLVVVQELQRTHLRNLAPEQVIAAIRQAVLAEHELQVYAVLLLKTGHISKTSSGKIQRRACRDQFLAGNLAPIASSILEALSPQLNAASLEGETLLALESPQRQQQLVDYLQQLIVQVLQIPCQQVKLTQPLGSLGIDSFMAMELQHTIETNLGVVLPMTTFLGNLSIHQVGSEILNQLIPTGKMMATDGLAEPRHKQQLPIQNLKSKIQNGITPDTTNQLEYPLHLTSVNEYPLTYGQQALYFLQQLAPESPAYNIARAMQIHGELNISALHRAFQAVVERHPCLRTTLRMVDEQPVQLVHEQMPVCWHHEDVSMWDEQLFPDHLVNLAHRPFNLQQGPLLRVSLFTRSSQEHILLLVVHHIVADMWSLTLLVDELGKFYTAAKDGTPLTLPPVSKQYADYILASREILASPAGERLWAYWKRHLAGELPILNLPVDRPRPPIQTYQGATYTCKLSREITHKLKEFSRHHQVTLYTTLLTAFQALLYRYTGQEDILVGSPTSGRHRAAWQKLVGYLVNPVVLKANFAGNPTFTELLHQVHSSVLDALTHQEYPFSLLVERLVPVRDPGRSPIFQVMFVWQKAQLDQQTELAALALDVTGTRLQLGDLELTSLRLKQQVALFDLTLMMAEIDGVLTAAWQYNTDLFDTATITRMAGHLQTLIDSAIANPQQLISHLPLLTNTEQRQLLYEFNPPTTSYQAKFPPQQCLHQLFVSQVQKKPDTVAIACENEQLTYQQLNAQANQIAHYLQRLGVAPEVKVGICVERSLEMIIGILGILKAGGAYVPLDPAYPPERLKFILEDAAISVLVTQNHLLEILPAFTGSLVQLEAVTQESQENPSSPVTPDNLAYVIYTSGSTGQPKGVLVNHAHVVRLFTATDQWFQFQDSDVWTMFHSYAFDFSVWEIWGALIYGGRLIIVPYWVSRSPTAFYSLLCQEQVTVFNQTPSAFRQLMHVDHNQKLSLRLVIFGGEALEIKSLKPWFDRYGDKIPLLVNMYGITETTVHVTYRPLTVADLNCSNSVIGRPIPDLQVYLLDQNQQLVPIGVPGEIYIKGAGVARGYLNRPELTQAKFIDHALSIDSATKLYKTGDLGRYLPNGEIEYLGRIDQQVKIRGFRIELGEIEAKLRQHPAIAEVVVLIRTKPVQLTHQLENTPGITELRQFIKNKLDLTPDPEQKLIAYCIPSQQPAPTVTELRQWLKTQLPEYMIPTAFVMLEHLPLTPNGKLDQQALPYPEQVRPELETTYVAPQTPVEKTLAAVWSEVMRLERVGIDDNFFELGGDSIRSIQVLAKSQERGLNFSLQQLFQHQTIYRLAQVVNITEPLALLPNLTEKLSLISLDEHHQLPPDVEDAYPLARIQSGVIFHSQYSPDSPMYHDIFLYHLKVHLDIESWQQAIQDLVTRHPILRTSFDLTNFNEPLQLVHRQVSVPLQVEDFRSLSPIQQTTAIETWVNTEKQRHFDWTCPPMIRFFIHRLTDESFYLVLSFHDCILDGWSTASLLTELLQSYWLRLHHQVSTLALPPGITYRDFVALERSTLHSAECRHYWTDKLQDCTTMQLPRWSDGGTISQNPEIGVFNVPISSELSYQLKQLAQIAAVPLKNVLLAAHIRVMSLLSGESDVLTGLESNGRLELAGGEQTLGVHLNTVPFRVQLTGGTWIDLVQQVFQTEQELLPFRRYPYAELKKLNHGQHLFETVFNYTHFHVFQHLQSYPDIEIIGAQGFGETHFTLRVEFNREPLTDRIQLDLECGLTQIQSGQLKAIGNYYLKTLTAMAQQPSSAYESQCLLPSAEQHQLLVEWNNTNQESPPHLFIPQWFAAQVAQTPAAIALVYADQSLTYQELNTRSNQLTDYLQTQGVKPETVVGICVERSLEMMIGILGILKAGGAYLPLDPNYPQAHFDFIFSDAQVSILLTQAHLAAKLETQAQIICLDTDWNLIAKSSTKNPINSAKPDNLAYIIYTSGFTGKPKGVAVTHNNLVHSLYARISYYSEPIDKFLLVPSFAFDSSIAVIFWTLLQGGTLVLPTEKAQKDIWQLAKVIAQHHISHWLSVPSLYINLLTYISPNELASLRTVIVAGESCSPALVQQHWQLFPQVSLFNEYGPTEATVWSTVFNCRHHKSSNIIPIGRPVAHTQIYLLDDYLQPVPVGVVGEIYIGGMGIVRGYLNQPELTAEKFIPSPFSNHKLYKTGDLGRYLPNGNIEFLGRRDYQVKIRGYRIELESIEAVLQQHPNIQQVVVIAKELSSGNQRLIAYIVTNDQLLLTTNQLQIFLKQKLPDYMIPSKFIILDALPVTANGKIDRRHLPTPESQANNDVNIARILKQLEQMSDAEAKAILAQKKY